MLNDNFAEQTSAEEMTGVYNYLINFFLLDLDFTNTPEDIFEESINTHILFKNGKEIKKSIISQQEKRRNNFRDMIIEAYTTGESRKMTVSRCRDADYILEMNLIRSKDTQVEDYYDNETVNGRFVLLDDGRRDNIVYDNATGKEYSLSYDVKEVVRLLNTIK